MHRQIDFTATFKKLRSAFILFNDTLKLKQPDQFRKLSLKATHMETARELIRCYAAHLLKPGQIKLEQPRTFHVSSKGVGKNKLQHKTTIYRHVLVLMKTGVIVSKKFHGSLKGIELEINQEILVYKNNVEDVKAQIQAELDKLTIIKKDKVATCSDKDAINLQETYNINKGCGYVDNGKKEKKSQGTPTSQNSTAKSSPLPMDTPQERSGQQKSTRGVAGDDPEFQEIIDFYTKNAWHFARSVLYPKQELTQMQENLAIMYVRDYFALIQHEIFKRKFVDKAFEDFCKRIVLAKRYVDRSPERFIPLPHIWFNKYFAHGFCGTLSWLNKVKSQKTALGNYIKKLASLCDVYKQYLKDPNVPNYYVSLKKLESIGDEKLVEYFNHCVVDKAKFDVGYLGNYYKNISQA